MKKVYLLVIPIIILLVSCIKDAAQNPECDILSFSFTSEYQIGPANIGNTTIVIYPVWNIETLKDSSYTLTITPGASYEEIKNSNTESDTLLYIKVTSESKEYSKTYSIVQIRKLPQLFSFDNWTLYNNKYENPVQGDIAWKSGNDGLFIIYGNKKPEEYPTHKTTNAVAGPYAAEMVTMVGPGKFLNQNIPCVAGSLFLGIFRLDILNPLKSTRFGIPFSDGKPLTFKGYYKYKEGNEDYINKDGTTDPSKRDNCNVYALIYEIDKDTPYLTGETIGNSQNIIAKASIANTSSTPGDDFVYFEVPFDYDSYTTKFNVENMENYRITIILSSSENGASYEGRPGSHLIVDELEIIFDDSLLVD